MQTAKEIFREYQGRAQREVNSYCTLRDRHPYHTFKEIERLAQKYLILAHVWKFVAKKSTEHYLEG